jgi:hypothetical protein
LVEKYDVEKIKRRVDKDLDSLQAEGVSAGDGDLVEDIRCPRCRCKMDKSFI